MAGIGFELVNLLRVGTYNSMLRAYGLTTLMGSGPGLFVLVSVAIIGFFNMIFAGNDAIIYQYFSVLIYLFSSTMIISSFLQYTFFRFLADKIFLKEFDLIAPNFNGVLLVQLIVSIIFALPIVIYFFANYGLIFQLLIFANFLILSMIWISTVLLTGLKSYRLIIWGFGIAYAVLIFIHFIFARHDLTFMLFEFLIAQVVLFVMLLHAVLDYYPSRILIRFDFLERKNFYLTLMFANFFYTFGFWVDKYLFWIYPDTSQAIFPPLRYSPIYDFPMFLSCLSIIPATSMFLLLIEAKFSMVYPKFMETIFRKKPLAEINAVKDELIMLGRETVLSLLKTQTAVIVVIFLLVNYFFITFNILPIYMHILFIMIIATGLNVILWGLLNILYYMTRYVHALYVTLIFFVSNLVLTSFSLYAGPSFYGYGFSFSSLVAICFALHFLNENFKNLEYTTFMMTD